MINKKVMIGFHLAEFCPVSTINENTKAAAEFDQMKLVALQYPGKAFLSDIIVGLLYVFLEEILSAHKRLFLKFKKFQLEIIFHTNQIQYMIATIDKLITSPETTTQKTGFISGGENV